MSNHEFDWLSKQVLDIADGSSKVQDQTPEDRRKRLLYLMREIYRAGVRGITSYRYNHLDDDALARLEWLAESGILTSDVQVLLTEVKQQREKDKAFKGTYGLTESDVESMVGEGFHTAFRKAVDHPYATTIHKLIGELPSEDWLAVVQFVAGPIIENLRRAEAEQENKEGTES